ncbi:MAG: hypothetical protein ALAOOOJD_01775 [bacterium]|nr:hypothetical protein [bacterium]
MNNSQPTANPFITFDCSNLAVIEAGGTDPSTVLSVANPFEVSVDFSFAGITAASTIDAHSSQAQPPAHWKIEYSAESIGIGPEIALGTKEGSFLPGQLAYSAPDTTLSLDPNPLPTGCYKLVAVITFANLNYAAGFVEGPMIQVF